MMTAASSLFTSLKRSIRTVEWLVILSSLIAGFLSTFFRDHPQLLPVFCAYSGAFFLLSWVFPIDRPVWQRQVYIAIELALILSALGLQLWFEVLMYFVLVKSCLLLRRRDVIVAAAALGAGYVALNAWILPQRIANLIARIQQGERVYDVQAILLVTAVNHLGATLFTVCFGFVLAAERKSRQQVEALAQQVESQAAALERTRIAREIHDSLGHSLTALDVQLELAQRTPTEVDRTLSIARQLAQQCLQDVRRSVQTLRSDFDLNQALMVLTEQVQQLHALKIYLKLQLPRLPTSTSHQLYCIVQEGLTNVYKHAQASIVHLNGSQIDSAIVLELQDDGIGFDLAQVQHGFGLRGMQERSQLLGGQLIVQTAAGQGTQIRVVIPAIDS